MTTNVQRIAFKQVGLILQKSNHKEGIKTKLDAMLATADPNNEAERTGCAQAFGYTAATHLDMTLERLHAPVKPVTKKSSSSGCGFLSSLMSSKDSKDGPQEVNNTVILAFGYISAYANPQLITSRIDVSIINHLKPIIQRARHPVSKECIIKTIELIAKAMHPSHLKKEYILKQRDELLKQLITYMTPTTKEKMDVPHTTISLSLAAATALV